MTDLTIHTARVCASNFFWMRPVAGSNDQSYCVTFGPAGPHSRYQNDYACTCPAYKFGKGKYCKHILAVKGERCAWGEEAFCGSFTEANPDGTCPMCGGETKVIQVGV